MFRGKRKKKADSPNKKVRNATKTVIDGIAFKSKLEAYCYEQLAKAGIKAEYESQRFTLLHSFKFKGETVRAMTYTPDFVGEEFIIECKGFANDSFPLRWKLFKYYLYMNKLNTDLYMPKNRKEVDEVVAQIVKLRNEREGIL